MKKKSTKKKAIYIALSSLLLISALQVRNVKLIVDSQALFGFQVDLTDARISFRDFGGRGSDLDMADNQATHDTGDHP